MGRRTRQRQRRRFRHCLDFRSLLSFVVIGLSCLVLVLSSSVSAAAASPPPPTAIEEDDGTTDDAFQTIHIPLSPLEFHINGKLHTDDAELARAKDSLTLAFFRLLRSHYGACLDNVDLKLSLEHIEPVTMPLEAVDEGEDEDEDEGAETSDPSPLHREEAATLVAETTATLYCSSSDMPSLSIKDVDEIIGRSKETFKHIASIVFTSSSPSNNHLYHSLVRIAFNASESRDIPTSTNARKIDGNDLHAVSGSIRNIANEDSSAISLRVLGSDVTCVPQVTGRMKLIRGEFICSPSLEYSFGMTEKGDLALLRNGETIIWSVSFVYLCIVFLH